jgi:hypothetical protein
VQELPAELGLPVPDRDPDEVGAAVLARPVDRSRKLATFFPSPSSFTSTSVARLPIRVTTFT